jgi:hypothetical protein
VSKAVIMRATCTFFLIICKAHERVYNLSRKQELVPCLGVNRDVFPNAQVNLVMAHTRVSENSQ